MHDDPDHAAQSHAYEAYDQIRRVFLVTQQLKPRCKYANEIFPKVSKWSVGQHIEHVLAVNSRSLAMLAGENRFADGQTPVAASPDALRFLQSGVILRGEYKAPPAVMPLMTNYVDLAEDVERGTRMIDGLLVLYKQIAADESLHAHPVLGGLTRLQWLRFLEIHSQHHLKIIADIVGQNAPKPARPSRRMSATPRESIPPKPTGVSQAQ